MATATTSNTTVLAIVEATAHQACSDSTTDLQHHQQQAQHAAVVNLGASGG